jgi:tetratricopeptide (TPR) repeat protein
MGSLPHSPTSRACIRAPPVARGHSPCYKFCQSILAIALVTENRSVPDPSFIQDLLHQALADHRAGRFAEAQRGYRAVLDAQPDQPDALHLLGVLHSQQSQHEPAIELIRKANAARPGMSEQWINLARTLAAAGRAGELPDAYTQACAQVPPRADLHFNFGILFRDSGQVEHAIRALRRAAPMAADQFEIWGTLAELLLATGQADQAIAAIREAMRCAPHNPGPHLGLATALLMKNQPQPAAQSLQQALALDPRNPTAMRMMAVIESQRGRLREAVAWARRGIGIDPGIAELHCVLGSTLIQMGENDAGIASLREALGLRPNYREALHDLGFALLRAGNAEQAIATYRRAVAVDPSWPLAHHALGHALLLEGNFREGLAEYEWRYKAPELGIICQRFPQPMWNGEPLEGRTILVHAEQGLGDVIMFARYLPLVHERGGRVILQCQPELTSLLRTLPPDIQVISRNEPLPAFDLHCPLLSLPRIFDTDLQTIPSQVPYLHADPQLMRQWRERLPLAPAGAKSVGIVWAGGPKLREDPARGRNVPLTALLPILRMPGMHFIGLQTGADAADVRQLPPDVKLGILPPPRDFADTAAVMQNLDLLITIDTAAAHLAGALARPTWVLLPPLPDWRWLRARSDSPWYPTMRLFRAPRAGAWEQPIHEIARALRSE